MKAAGNQAPPHPQLPLAAADQSPDLGTPRGRESCLRPFLASWDRFAVGGPGLETRRAERAGKCAGPGRGALTQAATSRPAAASSSRVGPTPGNSSGLGRLLSTSWASARPRATWRSSARDCGHRAGVRRGRAPARAPPPHPHPARRPRASRKSAEGPSSGGTSSCAASSSASLLPAGQGLG